MYSVSIVARAERELRRIDKTGKNRITEAIQKLASDPRPVGCRKIRSEHDVWRIRVGDYRIGYMIDDAAREIAVVRVGHRSEFYE